MHKNAVVLVFLSFLTIFVKKSLHCQPDFQISYMQDLKEMLLFPTMTFLPSFERNFLILLKKQSTGRSIS